MRTQRPTVKSSVAMLMDAVEGFDTGSYTEAPELENLEPTESQQETSFTLEKEEPDLTENVESSKRKGLTFDRKQFTLRELTNQRNL